MISRGELRKVCPNVLQMCLDVHMATCGSSDCDPHKQKIDVYLLESILKEWEPSPPFTMEFDEAVKNLIKITVKEWNLVAPLR